MLSLLDFIAAIHEMSAMIVLEPMLNQAFELMGGTQEAGLSVLDLHSSIQNRKERVTFEFLSQVELLFKAITDRYSSKPMITECLPEHKQNRVIEVHSVDEKTITDIFSSSSQENEGHNSGSETSSLKTSYDSQLGSMMRGTETRMADLIGQNSPDVTPKKGSQFLKIRSPRARDRPYEGVRTNQASVSPIPRKISEDFNNLSEEEQLNTNILELRSPPIRP